MSYWTYISGTITVEPSGRTNEEKEYILKTVLNHLPRVTGSEGDMDVYINRLDGCYMSSSHDEYGMKTNNLIDYYGGKSTHGRLKVQEDYALTLDASLRDRTFNETYKELVKWLCRLGKRVRVRDYILRIDGWKKSAVLNSSNSNPFLDMFEDFSWYEENTKKEPNWVEHLMWEHGYKSELPLWLIYKYYEDKTTDEEVERRLAYRDL